MTYRVAFACAFFLSCASTRAADPVLKHESFDQDPGWDSFNNHVTPRAVPKITQDFGYSQTDFAGAGLGEIGGLVTRASEPAFYAANIGRKTFDEPLSASGTFSLKQTSGSAGIFFGFFNGTQTGASGRPVGSLGMDMDCEPHGARLAVRLITAKNQSCGTFATPFIPGKFRPTPIRNDGTRYKWTLDYDPAAASGSGRFTFTLASDAHKPDELLKPDMPDNFRKEAEARFPHTTTFTVDLPPGYKQQGTTFEHFGLMNLMKAGNPIKVYFADLKLFGQPVDLSIDPKWDASGNRNTYQAKDVGGAHDFGFVNSNFAGGKSAGEIGGTFWRNDHWGYYADRVGPLTFDDRLEARGKIILTVGAPDSDMAFGWFRADPKAEDPFHTGAFIGAKIGGPTRIGHYFLPAATLNPQTRLMPKKGPVMKLGQAQEFSLVYDPAANKGAGSLTAMLGGESVTVDLNAGQRGMAEDLKLDHFGLVSIGPGGHIVKVYLDDLEYTSGAGVAH